MAPRRGSASARAAAQIDRGDVMGQLYLQRFVYRDGVTKEELDRTWGEAFATFARSGNWGGVEKGVTHRQGLGTGWGGYALIEVDDPDAFAAYQLHHSLTYGHAVTITFEPVFDLDRAMVPFVEAAR
ncbi:hypothetical protein [Pseudonocardia sp.]|uniref:hypothetical protein n=1 Tax=Pseudonocardia sp. TaxID=60912 RepID=UPI003D10D586